MPNRFSRLSRFSGARSAALPGGLLAALLAAQLPFPGAVSASCGLQFCPRPASLDAAAWEAGLRTRVVALEKGSPEGSGSYATVAPRLLWRPRPLSRALTLSAEVPVTRLQTGGESRTGLSNPLLAAVYGRRLSHAWSGEAGLQLELPLGDAAHGLADDHVMLLPWLGLGRDIGPSWRAAILAGYSQALERGDGQEPALLAKAAHAGVDHGDGEAAPVMVNPHGEREVQGRAGLSRILGRSTVEGFVLGQVDLSDGAGLYARAGLGWDYALGRGFGLRVTADAPVTALRRTEAEVGLGMTVSR